jgi:hypothetical protein
MQRKPTKMANPQLIDSNKIFTATNVRKNIHPLYMELATNLSKIEILKYIKIYNERIRASNYLSENKKKDPVVEIGGKNLVGVELLIDVPNKIVQFFSITSAVKGYGGEIISAVVSITADDDWLIVIPMDWSGGFWEKMVAKYPRLIVL